MESGIEALTTLCKRNVNPRSPARSRLTMMWRKVEAERRQSQELMKEVSDWESDFNISCEERTYSSDTY